MCKLSDTKYCDSVHCPHGHTLIDDADHVECKSGKCKESQCCKPVCSYYKCPKHYSLKDDSDKIKCHSTGCTTDKCCDYHCEY